MLVGWLVRRVGFRGVGEEERTSAGEGRRQRDGHKQLQVKEEKKKSVFMREGKPVYVWKRNSYVCIM